MKYNNDLFSISNIIEHDPPIIKGLKLKKYGIHLVYEDEDDYDGDERIIKRKPTIHFRKAKVSFSAVCKRKRTPLNLIVKLKAKCKRSRKKKKDKDLSLFGGTFCGLCKGALAHKKISYLQSISKETWSSQATFIEAGSYFILLYFFVSYLTVFFPYIVLSISNLDFFLDHPKAERFGLTHLLLVLNINFRVKSLGCVCFG